MNNITYQSNRDTSRKNQDAAKKQAQDPPVADHPALSSCQTNTDGKQDLMVENSYSHILTISYSYMNIFIHIYINQH